MVASKPDNQKRILDINGNVIFEGRAKSLKELVQRCVKNGVSLNGADLVGLDLMHLNLSNGDFTGARLDGARLNGSILKKADFSNASMRGISASGVDAEYAKFANVNFSPIVVRRSKSDRSVDADGKRVMIDKRIYSSFVGSVLTFAKFDGSRQIETDFSRAAMSSSSHIGAICKKSTYDDALLHNADWADAKVISNSFDGASMSPRMNVDPMHLPARTKNALIVGNTYKAAEIGAGNVGFHVDQMIGSKIKLATFGLVASGLFVGTALFPFDIESTLAKTIGTTATFIIAASAIAWIKTPIEDFLMDSATEYLAETAVKVRSKVAELWRRGKALGNLSVALLNREHANFVQQCLLARHDTLFSRIKAAATGEYDVIVCDREHLAEALARMSEMLSEKSGHKHSVILVRATGEVGSTTIPRAIVVNGDGGVEALWDEDENKNVKHLAWDSAKIPITKPDFVGPPRFLAPFNSHAPIIRKFIRSVLDGHGLQDFSFSHHTHLIRQGRDGSIVVLRGKDSRLDNRRGPSIITKDDKRLYFRNSVAYDELGNKLANNISRTNNSTLSPIQ